MKKFFGRYLITESELKTINHNKKLLADCEKTRIKLKDDNAKIKQKLKSSITITKGVCWKCGEKVLTTEHHAIPQHLKPLKNITIPVCRKCHDKIHFDDVTGMYSYIHKIEKTLKDTNRNVVILTKMVNEQTNIKKFKSGNKTTL